jgi:arabinose-5-phosphate isomerase
LTLQPEYAKWVNEIMTVLEQAIEVLKTEAQGILGLIERIDDRFVRMVDLIYAAKGRVIVSGIGKSGIIGRKIVATLNSTGTRALFLHPVEAMHGDLGMVCADDVFLALSYSGETDELNLLLPSIRSLGCTTIAFTGNPASTLAQHSDIIIDVAVDKEACPLGLAPTASSAALLAMGDALAVVMIDKKHFNSYDFRKYHPGGNLGQRLAGTVDHIMLMGDAIPRVAKGASMREAVFEIDRKKLGAALVLNEDQSLSGIVTDGDIRRLVAKTRAILDLCVDEVMTLNPKQVKRQSPTFDALNIMEKHQSPAAGCRCSATRLRHLHLHDILGKGEFKFNGH